MNNLDWCVYTYRHRRALVYIIEKLVKDRKLKEEMLKRSKVHDMDKMLLYLFLDQRESMDYHVCHQPHHLESATLHTYEDLVETVLDLECSPYTKPDKPLNAFDFTHKMLEWKWVTPETANRLFEIMHMFGIDSSYPVTRDTEGMKFVSEIGEVTEEMILMEVCEYMQTKPSEFEYIRERLAGKIPAVQFPIHR